MNAVLLYRIFEIVSFISMITSGTRYSSFTFVISALVKYLQLVIVTVPVFRSDISPTMIF